MNKALLVLLAPFALGALVPLGGALAGSSGTVRIETRPYYGATSTIEHGVRVIRPLPPDRLVIINPDGKAKVSVTVEDRRVVNIGGAYAQATAITGDRAYLGGIGYYLRSAPHIPHKRPHVRPGGYPGYPGLYRAPAHHYHHGHRGRR